MKTKSLLILFGVLMLILNTLGVIWIHHDLTNHKETVRVQSARWLPDNINPDRINITFDRDIVTFEQIGNTVGDLFVIEPDLPGKWRWQASNAAEFLLSSPIGPGRKVHLQPSEQFFDLTSVKLDSDHNLSLKTISLHWVQSKIIAADDRDITVEMEFNQPVDPGDLLRHATFYDETEPEKNEIVDVQSLTHSALSKITLRMPRPASDLLEIVLDEQLKGYQADLPLGQSMTQQLEVDPRFMFVRSSVSSSSFESTTKVWLEFSQPLSKEQKIPPITIKPEVKDLKAKPYYDDLVLTGTFEPAKQYHITIPSVLSSDENKTLGKDIQVTVDIPDRDSGVEFVHPGGILSPEGQRTLDLKAVNVSGLELKSWRVYENNLVSYLHRSSRDRTSQHIQEKTLELDLSRNEILEFAVELEDLIKPGPGIYYLSAKDTQNYWSSDSTMVLLSDLAITSKMSQNGVMVWVTSVRQGEPVKGVVVKGLSYQNQTLTQGVTDENGIAQLAYASGNPKGKIWLITAQHGKDLNYIKPADSQWVIDDVDQSGRPWPQSLEIMLYPERGVYRPGDKIHLTGIVRNKDGKVPPEMPFNLKVLRPDGKEIDSAVITPLENGQGVFHKSIQTTTDFQTGIYTFNMTLPGSSKVLGTTQASVEAFIPLRMKVDTQNGQDRYGPDETPTLQVSSKYLWEQPAAQIPVKVSCTLEARHFQSRTYKDYHFGLPVSSRSINVQEVAQTLDEQGKATINIPLPDSLEAGLYKLYLTATVTEPGARSVSSNTSAFVDKLDHHIGLKNLANRIIEPNEPLSFDWISLTGQDQPVITDQLSYELFSVEYHTVLKVVNRKRVWRSEEDLSKVTSGTIPGNNSHEGTFEINCSDSGYYRLIVKDAKTTSSTQLDFYASASASKHSLEMNQPEHLEIITDKKEYLPGQEVDVLIRSPIAGKAFVTIETDHVSHYQFAEVKDNSVKLTLPLSNTIRGSAYISAIVIRGVDSTQKDWLPHRALGMTRIRINHDKKKLPVTITAPDKMESEQTISVTVDSGTPIDPNHPAMIHLWAVDEGILLASDYRTPDPFNFFLQPRQPGVFGSDLFGRLMPDYERPKSMMRIGADSLNPRMLRRNPVPARHRKPDVIWNQVLPTDETGQIQVQMKLPKLIGQLRLMAVAFEQDRYGKSQKPLILSEDLIVEFSCPRFAAPGDTFMVPVKVFNNRTEPMNVALEIGIEGPLRIETPKDKEFIIEPQKSHTVMVQATALEIGLVDVKIVAKQIDTTESSSLTAESSSHFSVRPSTALHSEIRFKTIEAGESLTISPSGSFIAGTERLNLKIYSKPTVQMAPALEKLIGYPYGCVEQTTSRLFGLLYAHQILDPARADSLESMVQAGLTRLWGMQTRSGGLSYWPGGTRPYPWGSAYAGWCLMEAKKAGHTVDPRFSDELMKYLESLLSEKNAPDEIDQNTKALLCRVLTDFGRPPTGWMNSLAERKDRLDLAGLSHLAAAFHSAGRTQEALELLPGEDVNLAIPTTTSGRLTSRLQQQAVLLSVLLEMDPSQNMIAPLVAEINKAQSNGVWKSTLENAAAIVALSRYQIQTSQTTPDFTGQITFSGHSPVLFDHKEPFVHQINKLDESVQIETSGVGKVYIAQISEGLAKPDLMKPYDKRISVKRTWLDREKNLIDPDQLKVGDLVNVEIELVAKENSWIDNIAVVDALPGGMEVENPRLAGSAHQSGYQETAIQTEFLDDRVILFTSAGPQKRTFRYSLRVIAAGAFEIPPIQASCMYDPSIASLGTAGKMTVEP